MLQRMYFLSDPYLVSSTKAENGAQGFWLHPNWLRQKPPSPQSTIRNAIFLYWCCWSLMFLNVRVFFHEKVYFFFKSPHFSWARMVIIWIWRNVPLGCVEVYFLRGPKLHWQSFLCGSSKCDWWLHCHFAMSLSLSCSTLQPPLHRLRLTRSDDIPMLVESRQFS